MKKKKSVKSGIFAMIMLLGIFMITGCTFGNGGTVPAYYSYNVSDIDHCGFFYISKTTYYADRVEFHVNSRYEPSEMNFSTPDDANATVDFKKNAVILYSDNPRDITSLDVTNGWFEISFRYLDTDEYACIWRTWADDLGWEDYEGDKDKYYTEEEKEQQREAAERARELNEQREKEDKELFPVFEGKWECEDGDYFDIFDSGSWNGVSLHGVRYYQEAYQVAEPFDSVVFSRLDGENQYRITCASGDWGAQITFDIEYDGGDSFLYMGKEFTRTGEDADVQRNNRTREYFENLDKESTFNTLVEELGPCDFRGSNVFFYIWQLDDGTEARVTFDGEGKIAGIYIADADNNVDQIYQREE